MPFHPSNVYTIEEVNANLDDILADVAERAKVSFNGIDYSLRDKVIGGRLYCDQGVIAGCAGGGYENITVAADILRGRDIGNGKFTLNVYPASMPVYMELVKNGTAADLMAAGAVLKTAFCGPCFGAGDTPANNAFSIRHTTRNFPNREGSKVQDGQIASVALMDARSVAATAAAKGFLTPATEMADIEYTYPRYFFDKSIYDKRVYNSFGEPHPEVEIQFGPNIKDWPEMTALTEDIILKVVSEIHDPVTTTDELIPSGETSSFRSNPIGLAEFALSRKDPAYVGRAKQVKALEAERREGKCPADGASDLAGEFGAVVEKIKAQFPGLDVAGTAIGSTIYAVKPGDGSAREQAASCQKVLGGWANIARDYATKRYRSNLINWGMLPFIYPEEALPFANDDYIYIPGVRRAIEEKMTDIQAYVVRDTLIPVTLKMGGLTDDERRIILAGCLINFYRD
jgi:aconitate hydratase